MVRNMPANTGDTRDVVSIPESGRSGELNGTYSSILAWRILWTEEVGQGVGTLLLSRV